MTLLITVLEVISQVLIAFSAHAYNKAEAGIHIRQYPIGLTVLHKEAEGAILQLIQLFQIQVIMEEQ